MGFDPVAPWPLPHRDECSFYHSMDLPNGERIDGWWDIGKAGFDQYIGNYPLSGKSVLDVGTASGYLAFCAEQGGAAHVTALDMEDAGELRLIPFSRHPDYIDPTGQDVQAGVVLNKLKSSFWYSWHKLNSRVEVVYAPIRAMRYCKRQFDVVIAGAIIEHISDPVTAIGNMTRLAREAVIIAFTPVEESDAQFMQTANAWDNADLCFTWWTLSKGLYRRVFDNLGFNVEFVESSAVFCPPSGSPFHSSRQTIIAKRRG